MKKNLLFLAFLASSMAWAGGEGSEEVQKAQEAPKNEAARAPAAPQPAEPQPALPQVPSLHNRPLTLAPYVAFEWLSPGEQSDVASECRSGRDDWAKGKFYLYSRVLKYYGYFVQRGLDPSKITKVYINLDNQEEGDLAQARYILSQFKGAKNLSIMSHDPTAPFKVLEGVPNMFEKLELCHTDFKTAHHTIQSDPLPFLKSLVMQSDWGKILLQQPPCFIETFKKIETLEGNGTSVCAFFKRCPVNQIKRIHLQLRNEEHTTDFLRDIYPYDSLTEPAKSEGVCASSEAANPRKEKLISGERFEEIIWDIAISGTGCMGADQIFQSVIEGQEPRLHTLKNVRNLSIQRMMGSDEPERWMHCLRVDTLFQLNDPRFSIGVAKIRDAVSGALEACLAGQVLTGLEDVTVAGFSGANLQEKKLCCWLGLIHERNAARKSHILQQKAMAAQSKNQKKPFRKDIWWQIGELCSGLENDKNADEGAVKKAAGDQPAEDNRPA